MEEARVIELERLPPPLPSLWPPTPPPLQQQVEMERGQQAADGGVSVVVVAERWINGGGDSGEEWDPQAARQAAPQLTLQTSALVMPPFYPAEETEQQVEVAEHKAPPTPKPPPPSPPPRAKIEG